MPNNIQAAIAFIGAIAFFAGLFGGITIKEVEVSALPRTLRAVSVIVGVIFLGLAIWPYVRDEVLKPPEPTPVYEQVDKPVDESEPTPVPESEGNVLFEDDFETGNLDQWSFDGYMDINTWSIVDDGSGNSVMQGKAENVAMAETGNFDWHDYAFEARVYVEEATGEGAWGEMFNLQFYSSEDCSKYRWIVNKDFTAFGRENIGCSAWQELSIDDFKMPMNSWVTFRIEIVDDDIKAYINGQKLISVTDPDPHSKGRVGFAVSANSTVWFDDVRVIELTNSQ